MNINNIKMDMNYSYAQDEKEKSGFFDLEKKGESCNHPSHNPPSHIYIPQGKGYKHICPACKRKSVIVSPEISF